MVNQYQEILDLRHQGIKGKRSAGAFLGADDQKYLYAFLQPAVNALEWLVVDWDFKISALKRHGQGIFLAPLVLGLVLAQVSGLASGRIEPDGI